jgi:hypothetical protein
VAKGVLGFSRGSGSNANVTTNARNQVQRIARQKVSPSSHFSVEVNDIVVDTKQSTQIKYANQRGIAYLINLPGEGFRRGALRARSARKISAKMAETCSQIHKFCKLMKSFAQTLLFSE